MVVWQTRLTTEISRNYLEEGKRDAFTDKASYDRNSETDGEKMAYETREASRDRS